MMIRRNALFGAALLAGVGAVGLVPALAQNRPTVAAEAGQSRGAAHPRAGEHLLPGQMVDGRIAFLKAELKITPAQEAQWQPVADALRENAAAFDRAIAAAHQGRGAGDAVQQLGRREEFAKLRADNAARFLSAFKPLYASLSPEQQQMATRLVATHHHDWHHRG
jgi:protein CpxP